jgi:hypothetical protein
MTTQTLSPAPVAAANVQDGCPKLLTTAQVAAFVDDGFLILDGIIPADLCAEAIRETRAAEDDGAYVEARRQPYHFPWSEALTGSVYKTIIETPPVLGAITSLVGPDPQFDHYRIHRTHPVEHLTHTSFLQIHQDCQADMRPYTFDLNVSIYPQAVTRAMGGTLFVPGSHFRKVHNNNLYRYQHVRGSRQLTCSPGTVVLWHHNLWHSGRPNRSASDRIMFLARFNPRVPQVRLWDCSDLDQNAVAGRFLRGHPWIGGEHPIEWLNRIRLWRHMSGDADFDIYGYAKRLHHGFAIDRTDPLYRAAVVDGIPGPGFLPAET